MDINHCMVINYFIGYAKRCKSVKGIIRNRILKASKAHLIVVCHCYKRDKPAILADFSMVTGLSAILIRLFVSIMLISVLLSNPIPKSEILPSTWSILLPVAPSTTMLRAPSLMASLMAYSVSVSSFMGLSLCISVCPFLSKKSKAFVVAESKSPTIISA